MDFYVVDAFVNGGSRFSGNPAAVVPIESDESLDDTLKQKIAAEFNLSETVFVTKNFVGKKNDEVLIRWFTPVAEVSLCGHATLAATHALFTQQCPFSVTQGEPIQYRTKFGTKLEASISNGQIALDFPLNDCVPLDPRMYPWIEELKQATVGDDRAKIVDVQYSSATKKLLLRLVDSSDSNKELEKLKPNFEKLVQVDTANMVRGLIVTQRSSCEDADFCSRYFAPWVGIDEDPVTGSAHTVLFPYWSKVLGCGQLRAKQLSKRTGLLQCKLLQTTRVEIKGQARLFSSGKLFV